MRKQKSKIDVKLTQVAHKEEIFVRPMLDGMDFDHISANEKSMVERVFSEEEV